MKEVHEQHASSVPFRSRLSWKIIFTVSCATCAIVGVFAVITIGSHRTALLMLVERSANRLSETVKNSTKHDMLINHRESVHRIIDTIGRQEGIGRVRIFNKEGEIAYSSSRSEIGTMVDKRAEACYVCHAVDLPLQKLPITDRTRVFTHEDGSRELGVINPIENEPLCWQADCHAHESTQKVLGVLDITMSLDEVDRQIAADGAFLILFAIVSVAAISVILWLFVRRFVARPVGNLVRATNAVAAGNLSHRIDIANRDEMGLLADSFNEMTRKLTETKDQLYHADKLASLGRLAASVAHEINNPLTGILTYGSYLQKRSGERADLRQDIDVIVRETKRCREIIRDLLDFARRTPPKKSLVDLHAVIDRAVTIVRNQMEARKITVRRINTTEIPKIEADAGQIQQVMLNLLVNASDAIGERGGAIEIETSLLEGVDGRAVAVRVADDGCGIPAVDIPRIFEPFRSTKDQKGIGLGLAVAWGIVQEHRGSIRVESAVGKGSTFVVTLPIGMEPNTGRELP